MENRIELTLRRHVGALIILLLHWRVLALLELIIWVLKLKLRLKLELDLFSHGGLISLERKDSCRICNRT